MPTGTVKFFKSDKGYGFIAREEGNDIFVHYSNIMGDGYRVLDEGQHVEFEVMAGRKGDEASNVRVIESLPSPNATDATDATDSPSG